jgi:hypothetical protein
MIEHKIKWKLRSDAVKRPGTYTVKFGEAKLTFDVDKDGYFEVDGTCEVPLGFIAKMARQS